MNKYIAALLIGASFVGLTACNDYLDEQPQSSIIPEGFFNSADNLAAYSIKMYGNFPVHDQYTWSLGTFIIDNGTDNQAGVSPDAQWCPGEWRVPTSGGEWDFSFIRDCNYFLQEAVPLFEAGKITGSSTAVRQYIGEMYFFRAYAYYLKYKELGDFPIITEALPDNEEVLLQASVRKPRNQVARFILDDLAKAIDLLPESAIGGKQRVNRACAQLLRSRVALFEGTWLKHHKGTAMVPGGPGWTGNPADLEGFNLDNEVTYFLTEAMASAKPVADAVVGNLAQNTGTTEGYSDATRVINPYYAMFTEANLDNYAEVLLYKSYVPSQSVYNNIYMQFQRNGGNSGWTLGLVNSFLMRNGLPIYATGSGYDPAWENQGITATLQDRDSRIQIFTKQDGSITCYNADGTTEKFREGWLLDGTSETRAVTGFSLKKGQIYTPNPGSHDHGVQGSIIFRATEAMLNYMEACVEKNGSVDGSATNYWQALRRRAMVDTDFNKTIAATDMNQEALGDWGAYSHGSLVSPLLYNVRRERRDELTAEGLRMDDVRRWAALDQMINTGYQIQGMKYWGTCYDVSAGANPLNLKTDGGEPLAAIVSVTDGKGNMSDPAISGPYVRPYQISKLNNPYFDGYRFTRAHYLSPIAQSAFRKASPDKQLDNSVIYPNPGWPKVGGEAAQTIQ